MEYIKLFCPATIANVSCGFDVLGLCLDTIGDEMIIRKVAQKGVRISRIDGASLPFETHKNVAGVAAMALLEKEKTAYGFEIEIIKKIKPGSGIGSSAASAAGVVFGINKLLGTPYTQNELVAFAMQGEYIASKALHADNVGPAILGGFTLIRGYDPIDIIKIHSPKSLFATVIHPHIEIKTAQARALIKKTVLFEKAVKQWGNLGGLISGLFMEDYALISRSLKDEIVEPLRSKLIPGFDKLKQAAINTGALGSGISGSGPSVFALSKGKDIALDVAKNMSNIYTDMGIAHDVYVSPINMNGIKILNE